MEKPTRQLHYVGICEAPPKPDETSSPAQPLPEQDALNAELRAALGGVLPGFQRFLLAQGRVSLTLCVGSLRQMLAQQQFEADEVLLRNIPHDWDKWTIELLARRCRRGTVLKTLPMVDDSLSKMWASVGFTWQSPDTAVFDPAWELRSTRKSWVPNRPTVARCAIVGGGLSGAAVANALAHRGWAVTVLDSHAQCAGGGSGLPVGLAVPHISADDSPRSRLSRVGLSLTLQHARRLLRRGEDWDESGVLELTSDAQRQLNAAPALLNAGWLEPGHSQFTEQTWANGLDWGHSLWHPHAGWIKPTSLVRAWLAAPGIDWLGGTPVHRMERVNGVWVLYQQNSDVLARAEVVVVANAFGATSLVRSVCEPKLVSQGLHDQLHRLQALHGTVSHRIGSTLGHDELPPFPVNGSGSLVSFSGNSGQAWFTGASFEHDAAQLADRPKQHAANLQRLSGMLPAVAKSLSNDFSNSDVGTWTGTRCVSHDRLPLVGSVDANADSGLWISAAMGSRGLSFAALCAEVLAARLGGEPLPIEARLARSLDANRPVRSHP